MNRYVEAPEEAGLVRDRSLFLAGGITDCPNWQAAVVESLVDLPLTVFNPRRANFPIRDPAAAQKQIEWEYRHLRLADAILFWFPCETLCPIVLYELGAWAMASKQIFVGTHPAYARRSDVRIQLGLARPDVVVTGTLSELLAQVGEWVRHQT